MFFLFADRTAVLAALDEEKRQEKALEYLAQVLTQVQIFLDSPQLTEKSRFGGVRPSKSKPFRLDLLGFI